MEWKILTPLTYNHEKAFMESYDLVKEPSLTIPDETLSIQEILYRFTNGIVDFDMRNAAFDGEFDKNDDGFKAIDEDVNPINDVELSLSDLHERMQYHYGRYQDMIELEKQKVEDEKKKTQGDT